mmetsp:Transcript_27381/g.74869  ORF Transcript_27381/g.74869 Transcript_27381/m.74869 type:complete len:119 (+) Transcript_27381:66-422(+)
MYQDNQSAIKLEKNGMRSSSRRTRHINIRYFFVTDRIAANELSIEYCPTLDILADYFTKPLQGALFRKFRNRLLGIDDEDIPSYNVRARAVVERRKQKKLNEENNSDVGSSSLSMSKS